MPINFKFLTSLLFLTIVLVSCNRSNDSGTHSPSQPVATNNGGGEKTPAAPVVSQDDEKDVAGHSQIKIPGEELVASQLLVDEIMITGSNGTMVAAGTGATVKGQVEEIRTLMENGLKEMDQTWQAAFQQESSSGDLLQAENLGSPEAVLIEAEGGEVTSILKGSDPMQTHRGLESQIKFDLENFAREKLVPLVNIDGTSVSVDVTIAYGDATKFEDSIARGGKHSNFSKDSFAEFVKATSSEEKANGNQSTEIKYIIEPTQSASSGSLHDWHGDAKIEVKSADQIMSVANVKIHILESKNLVVAKAENLQQPALFYAYQYNFTPFVQDIDIGSQDVGSGDGAEKVQTVAVADKAVGELAPALAQLLNELGDTKVAKRGVRIDVKQSLLPNPSLLEMQNPELYSGTATHAQVEPEIERMSNEYWSTRDAYVTKLGEQLVQYTAESETIPGDLKTQLDSQVSRVQASINEHISQIGKLYEEKIVELKNQAGENKEKVIKQIEALEAEKQNVVAQLGQMNFENIATQKIDGLKSDNLLALERQVLAVVQTYKPESSVQLAQLDAVSVPEAPATQPPAPEAPMSPPPQVEPIEEAPAPESVQQLTPQPPGSTDAPVVEQPITPPPPPPQMVDKLATEEQPSESMAPSGKDKSMFEEVWGYITGKWKEITE